MPDCISARLQRHIRQALNNVESARELVQIICELDTGIADILTATVQPMTGWFNVVDRDAVLAPTPGTIDADAASRYGRVAIPQNTTVTVVHFHYDHPAGTGAYALELWRERSGVRTLIANCVADGTEGDFGRYNFTFVSEALKELEAWDYLLLQTTAVMTGTGSKNAAGFVDVHYGAVAIFP